LSNRIQLIARFSRELPESERPEPSESLRLMFLPAWGGIPVTLAQAILLEKWKFDLPEEIYQKYFPKAINMGELSKECKISEDQLRENVFSYLGISETKFQQASKTVRDRFSEIWKILSAESKLALLQPSDGEGKGKARWGLGEDLL